MSTLRDELLRAAERLVFAQKPKPKPVHGNQPEPEKIPGCPHKGQWTAPHPCPYDSDVLNDSSRLCRCCSACQENCADDI